MNDDLAGDITNARAGSDFYYASLYRSPAERERVRHINTLHTIIAAIPLEVSDRGVARIKLDWWHTEAAELADGRPRHELTRAYFSAYGLAGGIAPALHALATGLDRELGGEVCTTADAQSAWFDETFGGIYQLYASPNGEDTGADALALRNLGRWIEIGYALLQLRILAVKQLHRFPAEALASSGCGWEDFTTGSNAGAIVRFVNAQSARINDALDEQASRLTNPLRRRARTLLTLAAIMQQTLRETQADQCRVWLHRVHLTPIRKLWCAFRTRWN